MNSITMKALRSKYEKSLHVLPAQETSSWSAWTSWKMHYNPSENW